MENHLIQAKFYQKSSDNAVDCRLCNHFCHILPDNVGICTARKNIGGELYSLVYGRPAAINIDPIEKKPLYHFLPGSSAFSVGTLGCNFRCANCHNYEITQSKLDKTKLPFVAPEEIIAGAERAQCQSIAYTYNEPTIFTEYALDIMKLARAEKLKNIWVSNGFMSPDCLEAIIPYLDAANIDLKSMADPFYNKVCHARVEPILENLKRIASESAARDSDGAGKKGVHLEITTLVIPTLSDNLAMLKKIAEFIAKELGKDTPWHLSRFSPEISWKLKELPETSREILAEAYKIGKEAGLNFVYASGYKDNTYCPNCGELAIERIYYQVKRFDQNGKCLKCGEQIFTNNQ
ncbi:MAG: AmmeMemoRadiSam system radical SAM enzyme [Patescibacteria group bacterium]|nr:AmmeMemoRadiSam system radical SAM enzyme [Patescibacteria group bacterium]